LIRRPHKRRFAEGLQAQSAQNVTDVVNNALLSQLHEDVEDINKAVVDSLLRDCEESLSSGFGCDPLKHEFA
jgi:hypothetical protein